jgi:hypothetical protein
MRIKRSNKRKREVQVLYILFPLLLIVAILFLKDYEMAHSPKITKEKIQLETPTKISYDDIYVKMITEGKQAIYTDSVMSIYTTKEYGIPKLVYVYRNELTEPQKNDNFYLHVFLKSDSLFKQPQKSTFLSLNFKPQQEAEVLEIDGRHFYLFKKTLSHPNYLGDLIQTRDISHINTGRLTPGGGRSKQANNLKMNDTMVVHIQNNLDVISISISEQNFNKIRKKRNAAVKNGVLLTSENDLVPAKININTGFESKAEIRLKGDWTDHLKHPNKWSYRVILNDEQTMYGMRKLSIQHPMVRNYAWEWLFNKVIKDNDLIGLRYDFAKVNLHIKRRDSVKKISMGIMALEESFDKILIENNRRREGLILAFDESLIWKDREKQFAFRLDPSAKSKSLQSIANAPIRVYNEGKVLTDPKLSKQLNIAKDLLDGLREGKFLISEVFDMEKLTTFVAISNLFGGYHGLFPHNLRIYYNPITNKLEPISFDSNSGEKLTEILQYPFYENDQVYLNLLAEKLKIVSSEAFINAFMKKHDRELKSLLRTLNTEYKTGIDLSILEYNSNFIKKKLSPSDVIVSSLVEYNDKFMEISVNNVSEFTVEIAGLEHSDGKKLSKTRSPSIMAAGETTPVSYDLDESFIKAFVSKKNKKSEFRFPKDLKKIRVPYQIMGTANPRKGTISPFGRSTKLVAQIANYKTSFSANYLNFNFIKSDTSLKKITIEKGQYLLEKTLIIPKGFSVIIESGVELDFRNNASLISYSSIECKGTKTAPVKFYSTDGTGSGIFVTNAAEKSVFNYCHFGNLSNPSSTIWELSGAVNFHESEIEIKNSLFEKNRCEDALNIIRSSFSISNTTFKNSQSDAFDGDFVKGTLSHCKFYNSGNDGIDVSGSQIFLKDIYIENSLDKGISAGENSTISGSEINILGGEIGIVSKDLSTVTLSQVTLFDAKLGFSAFQKKTEYGKGSISIENLSFGNIEAKHLIETGSQLLIDNVPVKTVSNSVIDQLYGKKYGKSSS